MVKNKSIIAFFLSLIIIFNSSIVCFADGYPVFSLSDWNSLSGKDKSALVKSQILNYVQMCTDVVAGNSGAIVDAVARQVAARYVLSGDTDTDVGEYIANGMSLNDDGTEIIFSPEVVNLMRDAVKTYVDSQGFTYAYSAPYPNSKMYKGFQNINNYRELVATVNKYSKDHYVIRFYLNETYFAIPKNLNLHFVGSLSNDGHSVYTKIYNDDATEFKKAVYFKISGSTGAEYRPVKIEECENFSFNNEFYLCSSSSPDSFLDVFGDYKQRYMLTPSSEMFKVYNTVDDLKKALLGMSPYYLGKNFTTDHVTSPVTYSLNSITNAPTYEIVTNYINEYNGENQSFPSDGAIANYISGYAQNVGNSGGTNTGIDGNNNNTGVGNNNNVGGSGGSSSNGSGSSGGDVFGFLGGIGSVFGSLIKGVGELITNLLTAITEVMTSLTTEVPDSVIGFMGSLMSWVPPDIWILVRLAMVLGLVMAVVKKFF